MPPPVLASASTAPLSELRRSSSPLWPESVRAAAVLPSGRTTFVPAVTYSPASTTQSMAFKGGTCIRKTWLGSNGRFSTDVDFTAMRQEKSADDFVLQLAEITAEPFHGIQFDIDMGRKGWYEPVDGVSWGVAELSACSRQGGPKLQVSNRETPTLPPDSRAQLEISYFKLLPFKPAALTLPAHRGDPGRKIRATYQRNKPRDIWDLDRFADRPLSVSPDPQARRHQALAGARQLFARCVERETGGAKAWDWDDLRQLVRGGGSDPKQCWRVAPERFAFLPNMNARRSRIGCRSLSAGRDIHQKLVSECNALAQEHRLT